MGGEEHEGEEHHEGDGEGDSPSSNRRYGYVIVTGQVVVPPV